MPVLVLLLALVSLLTACGGGDDTEPGAQSQEALPSWIVSVRPEPGSESSSLQLVEVEHEVQTGGRSVRLIIDGVDVTSSSDFGSEERVTGPGLLQYDPLGTPETANPEVRLDAGEHTARVELVELEDVGGGEEVIDSFTWTFSIQ